MKLAFVYLGPTRELHGYVLEVLPRVDLHVYSDNGYLALGWLFWTVELQWKYRARPPSPDLTIGDRLELASPRQAMLPAARPSTETAMGSTPDRSSSVRSSDDRLSLEAGYLGLSLDCTGVCYFLPGVTIGMFAQGGGYVSISWLFWYASISWPARAPA